jgi:hypothetical protein
MFMASPTDFQNVPLCGVSDDLEGRDGQSAVFDVGEGAPFVARDPVAGFEGKEGEGVEEVVVADFAGFLVDAVDVV